MREERRKQSSIFPELKGVHSNISKINSEVRGGKSPRIKWLCEYIGESYFDYLAGLPDLVLLMDESHRYRASAGVRAINELKPIVKAVEERQSPPEQMALEGIEEKPDFVAVVANAVEGVTQQTIDIPTILVVPKGEVKTGFKHFTLNLDAMKYPAISDELWIQHLRISQLEVLAMGRGGSEKARLKDYVVSGLTDFDEISYDEHADLLYDLAGQTVRHFQAYLPEEDIRKCCAATSSKSPGLSTHKCRPTTGRRRLTMR